MARPIKYPRLHLRTCNRCKGFYKGTRDSKFCKECYIKSDYKEIAKNIKISRSDIKEKIKRIKKQRKRLNL